MQRRGDIGARCTFFGGIPQVRVQPLCSGHVPGKPRAWCGSEGAGWEPMQHRDLAADRASLLLFGEALMLLCRQDQRAANQQNY